MGLSLRPSRVLMRLRRLLRNDQLVLGLLALAVGALAGGAVIAFREGISLVQLLFFGSGSERLFSVAADLPWWWLLLAPTVGGLLVGLFIRYLLPGGRPLAVADVVEASAMRGGRVPFDAGIAAAVVSALSIGVGASVGREGPAVHLGATLGAGVARRLHLGRSLSRTMLGCGVASAVAASFNAPIAGALFAHEVVVGHYGISAFAPVVIAAVTGTVISRAWFGDFPAFIVPDFQLVSPWEFPAFAGLGLVGGVVAIAFMRGIAMTEERFASLRLPVALRPMVGGFAVGAIAAVFPQVLGVGYETTDDALRGALPLGLLAALLVAKLVATALSLGSGFAGGVFSPSIAIGALLGGTYGHLATLLAPELSSGPAAYSLVGMGAVAAAVLGAPISTTLILFELTGDYTLTVAVMVAVVVATVVTQQLLGHPSYFHWQLERRGMSLRGGHEARLLSALKVRDVMKPAIQVVPNGMGLREVRAMLQRVPFGELFVVAPGGRLYGTITLADLSEAAFDPSLDDLVNAGDAARLHPPALLADDDLGTAMQLMATAGEEHIAVIDDHDGQRLLGCVHQSDVLLAYNRALITVRAEERGERGLRRPR